MATECHVASSLAPAVPNPDTDDEPGLILEEESEDERPPNHLVLVRTFRYHPTEKKISFAPLLLTPSPKMGRRKNACVHTLQKLRESYLAGGPLP